MSNYRTFSLGRINPLVALLTFVMIIITLFWLAKGVLTLLSWAFPVVIIATAIINHRVILGYGRWVWDNFKSSPIRGLVIAAFTVLAHPIVGFYLLFRAISSKSEGNQNRQIRKGEFIEYEEVNEDFLDLSDIKKSKDQIDNKYKDLF